MDYLFLWQDEEKLSSWKAGSHEISGRIQGTISSNKSKRRLSVKKHDRKLRKKA
jgi:hypothetical protein